MAGLSSTKFWAYAVNNGPTKKKKKKKKKKNYKLSIIVQIFQIALSNNATSL